MRRISATPCLCLAGLFHSIYGTETTRGFALPLARREEIPCANVHRILVTDQGADLVAAFEFNAVTPAVAFAGVFAAGRAFPHGIDASSDARFVAITNYGDDTLHIHRAA